MGSEMCIRDSSIVTGKSSSPLDNLLVQAGALNEKPLGENYMSWDKPLQFFTNIYYNHPANWGASMRFELGTGRRYTRSILGTSEYEDGIRSLMVPHIMWAHGMMITRMHTSVSIHQSSLK